jgi:hypothetical protein
MNYFQDEQTAEYNRHQIVEAFQQIRLEQIALKSRLYQPGRFARLMFNFENWMISTGKQLRQRYEIPVTKNNSVPSKNYAHYTVPHIK